MSRFAHPILRHRSSGDGTRPWVVIGHLAAEAEHLDELWTRSPTVVRLIWEFVTRHVEDRFYRRGGGPVTAEFMARRELDHAILDYVDFQARASRVWLPRWPDHQPYMAGGLIAERVFDGLRSCGALVNPSADEFGGVFAHYNSGRKVSRRDTWRGSQPELDEWLSVRTMLLDE